MTVRLDQYKECNDQKIPLKDFQLQFCSRCVQPECTRSQYGKSRFDQRVTTWESRLFLDVPRMDSSDPRLQVIQAKNFHEINMGRVPEVQGWVDPRDLDKDGPAASPEPGAPRAPVDAPEAAPKGKVGQTPNRRGQMLGGGVPVEKKPKPSSDPWEPKKPPEGKIVKPGAKIRLGDS